MQIGAMNFPVRSVTEEIDTLAAMGFDYLELTMDPPGAHHEVVNREADSIRQRLADRGMGLVCHLPTFVSIADLAPAIRRASVDETLESLAAAARLGAAKAVLHPGFVKGLGGHVLDRVRQLAIESIDAIVARAQQLGVTVALENLPCGNFLFYRAEEFVSLLDRYPGAGLTLDVAHACIEELSGRRATAFVEKLAPRMVHLHLSDHNGLFDEHLALGRGRIGFKRLLQRIVAAGYDGTVTLEVFDQDRRHLAESRRFVQSLLGRQP